MGFEPDQLRITGNSLEPTSALLPALAANAGFGTPVQTAGFSVGDGSGEQRFELTVPLVRRSAP